MVQKPLSTHTYTYTYTYGYACIHTNILKNMCICIYIHAHIMHVYIYIHMYIYIYIPTGLCVLQRMLLPQEEIAALTKSCFKSGLMSGQAPLLPSRLFRCPCLSPCRGRCDNLSAAISESRHHSSSSSADSDRALHSTPKTSSAGSSCSQACTGSGPSRQTRHRLVKKARESDVAPPQLKESSIAGRTASSATSSHF